MSDDGLYQQTKTSLAAISSDLQKQLRDDLAALHAAVDDRLAQLDAIIGRGDDLFDRAAQDVSRAAAATVEQARREAEHAAAIELDAARAKAQTELASLRSEFDTTRTALEGRLAETEALRTETGAALEAARQELAAARSASDAQSAALDQAGTRVRTLEAEHAQWTLARQVAEAHLEEERQRRKTIAIQLETAYEELRLAKAEMKSFRLLAQQEAERVSRLEDLRTTSAPADLFAVAFDRRDESVTLEHLRKDLLALNNTQSADEMLTVLLEALGRRFEAAALFAVCSQGLKLWRGRRDDMPLDVLVPVLPLEGDSILIRAFKGRTAVVGHESTGTLLGDKPAGVAVALPLMSSDKVLVLAYLESSRERPESDVHASTKAAEILIDRANQRLQRTQPLAAAAGLAERPLAGDPAQPVPAVEESPRYVLTRQARRVTIHDGVKILIDGVSSSLVDLSTLGAQIVSPTTVRPNRAVRVVLQDDAGPVSCKGRIVWARIEPGSQEESVAYRAGLEFIEANATALQAFAAQHGVAFAPAAALKH
jgi:hypothetical protein